MAPLDILDNQGTRPTGLPLGPMPYHQKIIRHLQLHEADVWNWFSGEEFQRLDKDATRMALLKTTYRLDRGDCGALGTAADAAALALGVRDPVTFYRSGESDRPNASLVYMPGEVHIVLSGTILELLSPAELQCMAAHEFSHFLLLDKWREYRVAWEMLGAMARDPQAHPASAASCRLFSIYSEVYCDRGSRLAAQDVQTAISTLVKIAASMRDISVDNYLRQSDDIFAQGPTRSEGVTHPEIYMRTRSLKLWEENPSTADTEIAGAIEGLRDLEALDLLGQQNVSAMTRDLITALLQPQWLRTDALIGLARLFFDDIAPDNIGTAPLPMQLVDGIANLRDYCCYVLLDFAVADRELEDASLAATILLSRQLGLAARFIDIATAELKLSKKRLMDLEKNAETIVASADGSGNKPQSLRAHDDQL